MLHQSRGLKEPDIRPWELGMPLQGVVLHTLLKDEIDSSGIWDIHLMFLRAPLHPILFSEENKSRICGQEKA